MNLSELREDLADLLAGLNANVYFFPPEVPILPAAIVIPDVPYITPLSISANKYRVKFRLTFAVAMTNNQAALNTIEELTFAAYAALPVGYIVGETSDPRPTALGQSDVLSCEMIVEVITQTTP